jgi:outer membrane protein assembly factor BamD
MKTKLHYFRLIALLLLIAVLAGCSKHARREIPGPEESFRKAMNLFERERYYRAQELFRDIALNYSGSAIIDSTKFYLGLTYYHMRDYLTAADEFQRVGQLYPTSPVAPTAQYYLAMSYLEMAPSYSLDQKYTVKALDEFQRFLEDYNDHSWKLEAQQRLEECRNKLARKEYTASLLYYKMNEYASCVLYSDEVLANYYDTKWAGAAQLLKAKCYLALKDDERAAGELKKFLAKYMGRKEEAEVRALLKDIRNRRP